MQRLGMEYLAPTHSDTFVCSIEGSNGAGKTTLMNRFKKEHPSAKCTLCVPEIYQTSKEMKKFMLFESSALCSALYYLAGAVEIFNENKGCRSVMLDRSVWSTFASAYAKDETIIPALFNCLKLVKDQIFLPNQIIVLDASYETCRSRIATKQDGGKFDKDAISEFHKKKHFYQLLKEMGYPVHFIATDYRTQEEVYAEFLKILSPQM